MSIWKDYETNSQLVCVFGKVNAKIWYLGHDAQKVPNYFGIITPWAVMELKPGCGLNGSDPTLEDAKRAAEADLRDILSRALAALPPVAAV